MFEEFKAPSRWTQARLAALIAFFVTCFLFGGASRADALSQIPVRLGAIAMLAVAITTVTPVQLKLIKMPLLLLMALATIMLLQLIPLPPSIWSARPGGGLYAEVAAATGTAEVWRPLSLTPDLTLNSLLALLPATAALIGLASLPAASRPTLTVFVGAALLGCTVGILQLAMGGNGALYFYQITNEGFPVGFFANRNHQALFLAMAIPMLAHWSSVPRSDSSSARRRQWIAALGVIYLTPMILMTGSRAGLILAIAALGPSWLLWRRRGRKPLRAATRYDWALRALPAAALAGLVMTTFWLSRAESFRRIFAVDVTVDTRYVYLPHVAEMAKDFFPFGAGFGSFDPVFRAYEPVQWLSTRYYNHAHNDLLELATDGGLPALLVLLGFLAWIIYRSVIAWRSYGSGEYGFARLASVLLVMIAISSLFDYPLRTPAISAVFAACLFWLVWPDRHRQSGRRVR